MSDILDEILVDKRREVRRTREQSDFDEIKSMARDVELRDFLSPLQDDGIRLIAEIKPKAPSSGHLTELDPQQIAWVYQEESCVSCVSVLTDEPHFGMSLDDFRLVRGVLKKPVLRKEFIIDPFQVYRSALAGADAVLLIVSILETDRLQELHDLAVELGLQPLVEIHSREEWESIPFEPQLVGINNRTLEGDFSTDLAVTERLAPTLPDDVTIVSESGIQTHEDVERLSQCEAVDAILVGTSLLQNAEAPGTVRQRLRSLMGLSDAD